MLDPLLYQKLDLSDSLAERMKDKEDGDYAILVRKKNGILKREIIFGPRSEFGKYPHMPTSDFESIFKTWLD